MRNCLRDCMIRAGLVVLGLAAISGIAAYLLGVTIFVIGGAAIAVFPPGWVAALAAIGTVAVLGFLIAITSCLISCARRR